MNREEIFESVKKVVMEALGEEEKLITEDTSIVDELGLDSLYIVEMLMALEEEFDISIDDTAAEKFVKVSDVIDYIVKAKNN